MADDTQRVSNHASGTDAHSLVQVGVLHGDLTVRAAPRPPGDGEALLVSVTALETESTTCAYEGTSCHPHNSVHLVVEAYTPQAVILHRLRPVVVRRIAVDSVGHAQMMSRRKFTVDLDAEPHRYDADMERQALRPDVLRAMFRPDGEGEPDFPFAVSASDPEYFVISAMSGGFRLTEWRLELDWSCLGQRGTVTIDQGDGRPFVS